MAGIGLTLRKLAADHTYFHGAVAYFSSAIISAGPWLISVVSLALLKGVATGSLTSADRMLLFATITYAFVASSIITGPIQIVLTRIVADHIFLGEANLIAPTFSHTLSRSFVLLTLVSASFVVLAPFELPYRLLAGSLFLTVSLIWLVLAVLSAARDYVGITLAFAIGYAISGAAAMWLGQFYGLLGALNGFTLGQVVCLGLLSKRAYIEFPQSGRAVSPLSRYWRKYWSLALVGLLYYAGLWVEKVIYWFSPASTPVQGFYRTFPAYDSAILLAYLLTIPASAVFLVNLETEFYQHYRAYYAHILRQEGSDIGQLSPGTLKEIVQSRLAMIKAVQSGFFTLLKVQGMIATFAFLVTPDLTLFLGLTREHDATLRITVLAASGQVFVLYAVLLLLYVDARRQTVMVVLVFAASNFGLTLLTNLLMPGIYGVGYLLSTVIAALLGLYQLNAVLVKLDYLTFMLQPILPASERPDSRMGTVSATKVRERSTQ